MPQETRGQVRRVYPIETYEIGELLDLTNLINVISYI